MENRLNSIEYITNSILELEKKHELLEWKINGIFVWQTVRVQIYTKIQEAINTGDHKPLKSLKSRWIVILKTIYERIIRNSIFYNPFFFVKKTDAIVLESSRKYLVEDDYIDIYTEYLCLELDNDGQKHQIFQSSYAFDRLTRDRSKTKHLDFISLFSKVKSKFGSISFNKIDTKKIEVIQDDLTQLFSIRIDLFSLFEKSILKFKAEYPLYSRLFRPYNAKEIYLVNFCDKPAIIAAAKDIGITVIELQHGLMVKEDLIFHFPNSEKGSVAYFPDKFYVWEHFWGNSAVLPIRNDNIIEYGNRHIINQNKVFSKFKQEKNNILVISQPGLTDEIFNIILKNINVLNEFNIYIKLHPIEFSYYKTEMNYEKLNKISNVFFIENNISIYKLMAISKYCVGVYSTAILESLYFKCNVILLDLPGIEMFKFLLENNNCKLLKEPFSLNNYL